MRSAARTTSAVSVVSLDQSETARHSSNWSPPTSPPSMSTTRPNSSWTTWWSSTIPIGSSTPVRSKVSQQQGRRRALPAPTSTGSPTARSWNSGSKVTCLASCSNSASSPRKGREGSRSAGANGARQVVGVGSRQRVADYRGQPLLRRVILLPTRHGTKEPSMSLDEHKAILRASYEVVFNQHQVERAEEFYAPDYLDHGAVPGQAPGLEGAKQKWAAYIAAVPDLRVTIQELVAEGDKVAMRWTGEGTHQGELLGIPPTGKHFRLGGMSIYRLAEGKIAEQREEWDKLNLMQQLGVVPTPGQGTP